MFGRAQSNVPGVDLGSGSIKGLNLSANTVTSEQNLVLDPMGVVYDSITREPVPGVTLELEYNLGSGWNPSSHKLTPSKSTRTNYRQRRDV
ncbi:MAG: hypothetical protein R3A80_08850 [Bdellovibrionota bacterium]